MFKKILIANRGEIAVRVIRACREMGITSVAVYSQVDRDSLHVHLADEAHSIGNATPAESYLSTEKILEVARGANAEAIHPGYGFLSENPSFAEACEEQGFVFIGPPAEAIRSVGNKTTARRVVQAAGVPIVPGSIADLHDHTEAAAIAERVGYPILLKASSGGGGKGMRIVRSADQFERAMSHAAGEAARAFGDSGLYIEKLVGPACHIEVQLLADGFGNVVHLGERDCSIQRRYQKVIEESPSSSVDDRLRARLTEAAIKIARAVGYQNAGTVEFLVEGEEFYFLEVNARLQVEHPVTEMITGIDVVKEQILLAMGEPLSFRQDDIILKGAAIQCRLYAENPAQDFMPSPGTVHVIREPGGPGVRVDSGIQPGFTVPTEYDGLLTKLIVWGSTRAEAISRMDRALGEYRISGVTTTIPFKRFVMANQLFREGRYDTSFIRTVWDDWTARAEAMMKATALWAATGGQPTGEAPGGRIAAAAVAAYLATEQEEASVKAIGEPPGLSEQSNSSWSAQGGAALQERRESRPQTHDQRSQSPQSPESGAR